MDKLNPTSSEVEVFASTIEPYLAGGAPLPPAESFPDRPAGLGEKGLKIMHILEKCPGGYGAAIVRESDGEILEGSVYTTLRNLEMKGFVARKGEDGPGRERERKYRLTDLGMRTLAAHRLSDLALRLANKVAAAKAEKKKGRGKTPERGKTERPVKIMKVTKTPKSSKAPKTLRARGKRSAASDPGASDPGASDAVLVEELPPEAGDSVPT